MCVGGSAPKDNSAEIAQKAEDARQGRIAQGTTNIDNAFEGYNDDFFTGYQNDYSNYYNPQLDDQFTDANKKLTLQLAQTGNLTGSVGANQLADLQKHYDGQKTAIAGRAVDASNNLRGNIDNRKTQLYSSNRAAADPGNAASAAASAATSLQPAQESSPLANMFGDFFSNIGNNSAIKNKQSYNQGTGVQNYGGSGSNSSVSYL